MKQDTMVIKMGIDSKGACWVRGTDIQPIVGQPDPTYIAFLEAIRRTK
jgi:hypothetical protein